MSNLVMTTEGLLEFDQLAVLDIVEVGDNYRKIATEYRYQDRLVKRSVTVESLRGLESQAIEGKLGG